MRTRASTQVRMGARLNPEGPACQVRTSEGPCPGGPARQVSRMTLDPPFSFAAD